MLRLMFQIPCFNKDGSSKYVLVLALARSGSVTNYLPSTFYFRPEPLNVLCGVKKMKMVLVG